MARLTVKRSDIPAVTHLDDSALVQTVRRDAYRCFTHAETDTLVLEDYIRYKNEQPLLQETDDDIGLI